LPAPDADVWTRAVSLVGVELDPSAHLQFLETALAPYLPEFRPPEDASRGGFFLWNGYYQAGDAEVLYAMIRHFKPRLVLEIGSGFSTLVGAAACARNAVEGCRADFVAVDPDPRVPLGHEIEGLTRFEQTRAQDVPLERFLALGTGDVLFIDSSHTVKLGSEVNYLVLEVLPCLRPGVVVHFHDVFLPYEYPRAWYERGTYLSEQYLLHAFLVGNRGYQVLFAAHAVARAHRDRFEASVPSLRSRRDYFPAALWLRRTASAAGR
jgi:hypothetical protein